jgi:hypothetical protein
MICLWRLWCGIGLLLSIYGLNIEDNVLQRPTYGVFFKSSGLIDPQTERITVVLNIPYLHALQTVEMSLNCEAPMDLEFVNKDWRELCALLQQHVADNQKVRNLIVEQLTLVLQLNGEDPQTVSFNNTKLKEAAMSYTLAVNRTHALQGRQVLNEKVQIVAETTNIGNALENNRLSTWDNRAARVTRRHVRHNQTQIRSRRKRFLQLGLGLVTGLLFGKYASGRDNGWFGK